MLRRTIPFLMLLGVTLQAYAGQPLSVAIRPDFVELLPGTTYEITVAVEYVLRNPAETVSGRSTADSPDIKLKIRSPETAHYVFTAENAAKVATQVIHFSGELPPAVPGTIPNLLYRVSIKIVPPPRSGMPVANSNRTFGAAAPVRSSQVAVCLRVRGPSTGGYFFVGVSDCGKPIPKPPATPDRRHEH